MKSFPIVVVLIFEQHGKGDNDDEENEEEDGNLLAEANPVCWIGQPGGLREGSRSVAEGFWGGDFRATAREKSCTPAGVPDPSLPSLIEIGVAS